MNKEQKIIETNHAQLYCTVRGNGKPILLIHGAICDSDFYEDCANLLAKNYKVITYDRRGYSRSNGEIENDFLTVSTQDAAKILCELVPNEKAIIVGCSAGALIAMKFAQNYPELTSLLIAHEPPMLSLLPEDHEALIILNKMKEFIEIGKYGRAATKFMLLMEESESNTKLKTEETFIREDANMRFFIKNEFNSTFDRNLTFSISENVKMVIGAGDAHRDNYHFIYASKYANEHHIPFIHFPGKHNCAYDLPLDFAITIQGIIQTFI